MRTTNDDALVSLLSAPTTAAEARRQLHLALSAALDLSGATEGLVALVSGNGMPELRATAGIEPPDPAALASAASVDGATSVAIGGREYPGLAAPTGGGDRALVAVDAVAVSERDLTPILLALSRAALTIRDDVRSAQMSTLHATAQRVAASLELDVVLSEIVRDAVELLAADSGDMLLKDDARNILRVVAVANFAHDMLGFEMGLDEGVSARAMAARKTTIVDDYRRYRHRVRELDRYDFRAVICAPLIARGEPIGSLNVHATTAARRFSQDDARLLTTFANHAAIAIDNATRYQNEARLAEELRLANDELERSLTLQQRIVDQVLADRGPAGVAKELSLLLGRPLVVQDHLFGVLAADSPAGGIDVGGLPFPRDALADARVTEFVRELDRTGRPTAVPEGLLDGPRRVMMAIRTGRDISGYLVLADDGNLASLDRALIEVGSTGVALELAKLRTQIEAEARVRRDLVEDLVAGRFSTARAVEARAAQAGYVLGDSRRLVVFRADAPASETADERSRRRVIDAVTEQAAELAPDSIVGRHEGAAVVLLNVPPGVDVPALVGRIRSSAEDRSGVRLSAGVGPVCRAPDDYPGSFLAASQALDAMRNIGRTHVVVDADRLGVDRLLLSATDREELEAFAVRTLAPLLEDTPQRRELLNTLRAYAESGFNQRETARRCFVHFNTIAYRLRRVEALLGRRLDDADGLLDVTFALRIAALLELF